MIEINLICIFSEAIKQIQEGKSRGTGGTQ